MRFNVMYDAPDGARIYCKQWCDRVTADRMLALFVSKYLNPDGTGKTYPNGKGVYPFSNPRIVAK